MISIVEKNAISAAMEYERRNGRNPQDVSGCGRGYDIESSGRAIEVKGTSNAKPPFINFNQYNFKAFQKEKNFYLYIGIDANKKPGIIILDKNSVLERAKFQYHWEIPLWKRDYLTADFSSTAVEG